MGNQEKREELDSTLVFKLEKLFDLILPFALLGVIFFLYLEFVAASSSSFYSYKIYLQYSILVYFVAELALDFLLYEQNKEFFRDRWVDILLTAPFFSSLKVLKGAKVFKSLKIGKGLKLSKIIRAGKGFQKTGKAITKSRKLLKKAKKKLR